MIALISLTLCIAYVLKSNLFRFIYQCLKNRFSNVDLTDGDRNNQNFSPKVVITVPDVDYNKDHEKKVAQINGENCCETNEIENYEEKVMKFNVERLENFDFQKDLNHNYERALKNIITSHNNYRIPLKRLDNQISSKRPDCKILSKRLDNKITSKRLEERTKKIQELSCDKEHNNVVLIGIEALRDKINDRTTALTQKAMINNRNFSLFSKQ